jgi:hypothetical protein
MQRPTQPQQSIAVPQPQSPPQSIDTTLAASLIVALPIVLALSVIGYRKYRSVQRQRQIRLLEKIWQLSHERRRS